MSRPILEVIAQTLEDARAAARGGADRLEIVRDIDSGGLTPSHALVREIASEVELPLRIMIRRNAGYTTDMVEMGALREEAARMSGIGIDGLVVGFARDGRLELSKVGDVLRDAGNARVTLHRAFDQVTDPGRALDELAGMPAIDRVLTGGGEGSPQTRAARLRALQRQAGTRLTIIAGGGIDEDMIDEIVRDAIIREVHVGRAAREGHDPAAPVSADRVARLIERMAVTP